MAISSKPLKVNVGDVVRLKSGGPFMTAASVIDRVQPPFALCIWIDKRQVSHRMSVPLDALVLANPEGQRVDSS